VLVRDFGEGTVELIGFRADLSPYAGKKHVGAVAEKRVRARLRSDMTDIDLAHSVGRAKRLLRHKILGMNADRMLTLTYSENKVDLEGAWKDFSRFIRSLRKLKPNFHYCVVPERQLRGAIHFHMAIKGFLNVSIVRYLWQKAIGGEGRIHIGSPKGGGGAWQRAKLAAYLAKYMGKGMTDGEANARRYRASLGIVVPAGHRFYVPYSDSSVWAMTMLVRAFAPRGVVRLFEAQGALPVVWMASY